MRDKHLLWKIRLVHTVIWICPVSVIVAIQITAGLGLFVWTLWLSLIVLAEVLILLAYGGPPPLTTIARRHSAVTADNFDTFLPAWLVRRDKLIFGLIFPGGELAALWLYIGS